MPLGMEVGLSPEDFVFDRDAAPSPKRGRSPPFSAHVYCGQTAAWIKMPLGTEVVLGPDDIVLDGDPATPEKTAEPPPQISAHSYYGQMAGCIKMPLGMELGLSLKEFVFDGNPAPSPKTGRSPQVSAHVFRSDGCMDQDATWCGGRPRPRRQTLC